MEADGSGWADFEECEARAIRCAEFHKVVGTFQVTKRIRLIAMTRFKVIFIKYKNPGEIHVFVADLPKNFLRDEKLYDSQLNTWRTILEIRKFSNCDLILKLEPDAGLSEGEFWVEYPDPIAELLKD